MTEYYLPLIIPILYLLVLFLVMFEIGDDTSNELDRAIRKQEKALDRLEKRYQKLISLKHSVK